MATCMKAGCTNDAVIQWQRRATQLEIDQYIQSGDLFPGTTEATVPRYGCDDHKLTDAQITHQPHDADCTAPHPCNCSKKDLEPFFGNDPESMV
jgi:hypothetical protein